MQRSYTAGPIRGPVSLFVKAVIKRPKRLRRAKDPAGPIYAAVGGSKPSGSKPDDDNILKLAQDTLVQAGVLQDDTYVVIAKVIKIYTGVTEEQPRTYIEVIPLQGETIEYG